MACFGCEAPNAPKAATAARAFARPRGDGERSEFVVSEEMARLDGATSNQLFAVLMDWEVQLKHLKPEGFQVPPCP